MNDLDLPEAMCDAPTIKLKLAEIEITLSIFFSLNCCKIMFEQYRQNNSYRSAFAEAVFHMYQHTTSNSAITLSLNNFVDASNENLGLVLNTILEQDDNLKSAYDKEPAIDMYERFYKANETVLKSATVGISESFGNISQRFESLNQPLLSSLDSVVKNMTIPTDYLSGLSSAIASSISSIDFSTFQSALTNIPQIQFPELASVLSNIPQPLFDMQSFLSPLHNLTESIQHINNNIAQGLQALLLQMAEATQSIVASIDFSLLSYRREWSKQRETLLKYGWFYSDELPDDIINYIYENQSSLRSADVDRIVVDYFRKDNCKALKRMVNSWKTLPYFLCRARIFHEVLVHHSRKYFNSSVTLLTIHTEGIITDFVRTSLANPRYKVEKALEDIKKELDRSGCVSVYEYEVFFDVIEQIEEAFTENFKHSDPDAASNKSRHKIAHGHAYEIESEANSLKRFLYLNEIHYLFSIISSTE